MEKRNFLRALSGFALAILPTLALAQSAEELANLPPRLFSIGYAEHLFTQVESTPISPEQWTGSWKLIGRNGINTLATVSRKPRAGLSANLYRGLGKLGEREVRMLQAQGLEENFGWINLLKIPNLTLQAHSSRARVDLVYPSLPENAEQKQERKESSLEVEHYPLTLETHQLFLRKTFADSTLRSECRMLQQASVQNEPKDYLLCREEILLPNREEAQFLGFDLYIRVQSPE